MIIKWFPDINIVHGYFLPSDHLHIVSICLYNNKDMYLLPTVTAELRSNYEVKIAKLMSKIIKGNYNIDLSTVDELTKKIWKTIQAIKESKNLDIYTAIYIFKKSVEEFLKLHLLTFSDVTPDLGIEREYKAVKEKEPYQIFKKDIKRLKDTFQEIMDEIDRVFSKPRTQKDREILKDLIFLSYKYPSTLFCFLTNDSEFYKNWKKVYSSKFKEFKESYEIKYGIVFHYIPDLIKQSIYLYKMYPEVPSELIKEISLENVLKRCLDSISNNKK